MSNTKFCTKCGTVLDENDKFCKNCGEQLSCDDSCQAQNSSTSTSSEQNPINETSNNTNIPPRRKIRLLPIIIIIAIIFFAVFGGKGCSPKQKKEKDAIYYAESVVQDKLRAPTTARFYNQEILDKDGEGRYLIYLSVDAQNGFGAYTREDYYVVLHYNKKDSKYYYNTDFGVLPTSMDEELVKSLNDWDEPQ